MQINSIQQNKQVNFTSTVFIKNCSEIFQRKSVIGQIKRLEQNGKSDFISLKGFQTNNNGDGYINMRIRNYNTREERENNFFFEKGKVKLGFIYNKLLKEKPNAILRF